MDTAAWSDELSAIHGDDSRSVSTRGFGPVRLGIASAKLSATRSTAGSQSIWSRHDAMVGCAGSVIFRIAETLGELRYDVMLTTNLQMQLQAIPLVRFCVLPCCLYLGWRIQDALSALA